MANFSFSAVDSLFSDSLLTNHVPEDDGENDNHVDCPPCQNQAVKQGELFWKQLSHYFILISTVTVSPPLTVALPLPGFRKPLNALILYLPGGTLSMVYLPSPSTRA